MAHDACPECESSFIGEDQIGDDVYETFDCGSVLRRGELKQTHECVIAALRLELAAMTKERDGLLDVNYAAKNLPPGWQIEIELEQGSMEVTLYDDGEEVDFCDDDTSPADRLKLRVDYAAEAHLQACEDNAP